MYAERRPTALTAEDYADIVQQRVGEALAGLERCTLTPDQADLLPSVSTVDRGESRGHTTGARSAFQTCFELLMSLHCRPGARVATAPRVPH